MNEAPGQTLPYEGGGCDGPGQTLPYEGGGCDGQQKITGTSKTPLCAYYLLEAD